MADSTHSKHSYHEPDCPFCNLSPSDKVIKRKGTFFAKYDRYPVSKGHTLLIPKRHIMSFYDLTDQELLDFHHLFRLVRDLLNDECNPDGFNIGVNDGVAAGQTIPHLHVHVFPRYQGDVKHPAGGIRNFIPNLVAYPPQHSSK